MRSGGCGRAWRTRAATAIRRWGGGLSHIPTPLFSFNLSTFCGVLSLIPHQTHFLKTCFNLSTFGGGLSLIPPPTHPLKKCLR